MSKPKVSSFSHYHPYAHIANLKTLVFYAAPSLHANPRLVFSNMAVYYAFNIAGSVQRARVNAACCYSACANSPARPATAGARSAVWHIARSRCLARRRAHSYESFRGGGRTGQRAKSYFCGTSGDRRRLRCMRERGGGAHGWQPLPNIIER